MARKRAAILCDQCGGTKQIHAQNGEGGSTLVPCWHCEVDGEPTGYRTVAEVYNEEGLTATYEILEALDLSEYVALGAAQQEALKLMFSCGEVDLSEGTQVRTRLENFFPEGTKTRVNLETLWG